ncbi:MAG: HAD-IC family P-type ATPase [Candidatus Omnitrophica bacterium]|nr:HAD-IC family P-type ATPase [Candidatus Omnitrophota bacterium]
MSHLFYDMTPDAALASLKTSLNGLSTDEAAGRLSKYGRNEIPRKREAPWWKILFDQFKNPLILILLGAAIIECFSAGVLNEIVIFVVVLMMTGLGFFEELRARNAMNSLASLITPKSKLCRSGRTAVVSHSEIVPGDILFLDAGDKIPADARLVEASHLMVSEAALTGESVSVGKEVRELPADTVLADRGNMLYMGTVITAGRAVAVVTATGGSTEIGKIAGSIAAQRQEKTPLQKGIDHLSVFTTKAAGIAVLFVFGAGLLHQMPLKQLFMFSVAVAVSIIPEGLPFAVTAVLSIGMRIMARHNAIVRKLSAVETLGATTVICSDKTGTMTLNKVTVKKIYLPGNIYSMPSRDPALGEILRIGVLCNDAHLVPGKDSVTAVGDPTEGALLLAARASDIDKNAVQDEYPRIGEIPFHSQNKWMATLHDNKGSRVIYIKGALEKIIDMSSHVKTTAGVAPITPKDKENFMRVHDEMAADAMRVIAIGYADYPFSDVKPEEAHFNGRLVLCGLFGMIDPPRQDVIKAVADCKKAGIRVVMITGDNVITAKAIGREIGLETGEVLTSKDLASMDADTLKRKVKDVSIFARIDPLDKLKIVTALQANDHVVAMTGDGVNDAPALEKADIGVAMGMASTDVAKEASNMILSDDDFSTIVFAVEEGRAIFNRLRNVTAFMLTMCLGELMYLLLTIFALGQAPLEPIQILWLNIVAGSLIVIPLGFEPKTGRELSWPPRRKKTNLLYEGMLMRIFVVSSFSAVVMFLMYEWCIRHMTLDEARTVIFSADAVFQWFLVFVFRSDRETVTKLGLFRNKWLIAAVGLGFVLHFCINYFREVHEWFHVVPMHPYQWALAFTPGLILFAATILRKFFFPNVFSRGKW